MKKLRAYFLTGLIVILPTVVTLYVLWMIFCWIDGILGNILPIFTKRDIPGLGFISTVFIVMLAGLLAKNLLGRKILRASEKLFTKIPLAKNIYTTTKQIIDAFIMKDRPSYKRVVMVEYPRRGLYTLGFVTGDSNGIFVEKAGKKLLNVFFPTTPNPTSGWLALVPTEQVIPLDLTVEDGIKLIISGGTISPCCQYKEINGEDTFAK